MSAPAARLLAIGGSAGSLTGIKTLLAALSESCTLGTVICMHTTCSDMSPTCEVLARHCALPVVEACERYPVAAGAVYVAAGGYHLLVEKSGHFSLSDDEPVHYSRPSIDVLFDSVADAYRRNAIGVLLSGANRDGAQGLADIQAMGGLTMVQSIDSAVADMMPAAALARMTPEACGTPRQLARRLRALDADQLNRCVLPNRH